MNQDPKPKANWNKEINGWSLHNPEGWKSQLKVIRRWHQRFLEATKEEDKVDFLFAFFQNCNVLRDWFDEGFDSDEQQKAFKQELKELFAKPEMRLCRDICNMTKHCDLDVPPSSGSQPSLLREAVGDGLGWFSRNSILVLQSQNGRVDVRQLALRCLNYWEHFLQESQNCPKPKSIF